MRITTKTITMGKEYGLELPRKFPCEVFSLGNTKTCVSDYQIGRSNKKTQACLKRRLVTPSISSDDSTTGKVNARPNFPNLHFEKLTDEDLDEWLQRPDPTPPGNAGALEAHVRVLVCHQTEKEIRMPSDQTMNEIRMPSDQTENEIHMPSDQTKNKTNTPERTVLQKSYHVARSSFDAIEEHLRLPVQTLPTMSSMWGVQSSEFVIDTNVAGKETMCLGEYITGGPEVLETCSTLFPCVLCSTSNGSLLRCCKTSQ